MTCLYVHSRNPRGKGYVEISGNAVPYIRPATQKSGHRDAADRPLWANIVYPAARLARYPGATPPRQPLFCEMGDQVGILRIIRNIPILPRIGLVIV